MTQVTVKELAQEVEAPVERLLQQMREAGLPHTDAGQVVTDNEKQTLLTHLKSSHKSKAEEPRKITLQRKTTSTLRVAGSKSISVEVRKKKVFVQRSRKRFRPSRSASRKSAAPLRTLRARRLTPKLASATKSKPVVRRLKPCGRSCGQGRSSSGCRRGCSACSGRSAGVRRRRRPCRRAQEGRSPPQ